VIVLLLFFNLFATLVLLLAAWMGTAKAPAAAPVLPDPAQATAAAERPGMVNEAVARRAMGVGLTAGYVTGAATGIGVGAVIAAIAARLPRRRP
jgi:membrane protein